MGVVRERERERESLYGNLNQNFIYCKPLHCAVVVWLTDQASNVLSCGIRMWVQVGNMLDQQIVGATSLNAFNTRFGKLSKTKMGLFLD